MDLHHLHCFALTAEELHVTRAAERLQMAQPSLTRIIHSLEEELGFALFDSTNKRQLVLTPAGQVFLDGIAPLLSQYEQTVQVARRVGQGEVGKLVVGYTGAAMFSILPAILQAYQPSPEAELISRDISTHSLRTQLQALREHQLDVAFLFAPLNARGIAHEYVCRGSIVVALPVTHPLVSQDAILLSTLSKEAWVWIIRQNHPQMYEIKMSLCRQAGFEPHIAQMVYQPHAMISLVGFGTGVALVSSWLSQGIAHPQVVYRSLLNVGFSPELHILWRKDDRSPLVQKFLQVVRGVRESRESSPNSKVCAD
jgi:DNA-binding transcriptional LysR family regulator